MKSSYLNDNSHRRFKKRLIVLELIIFFLCMLIASVSEAQTTLIELNNSQCQHRLGPRGSFDAEPNFIVLAAFRVGVYPPNVPDLESITIELTGNFDANDLNNSTGGALFYTKGLTGFPSNQSIREVARDAKVITGPGVYTFNNPLVASNQTGSIEYGLFYILLEVSPDADEDHFWFRETMDVSNFLFDPPTSLTGSVEFKAGTVEPGPEQVEIDFIGKNGFIQAEIEPSSNEGYTFEVWNSATNQLVLTKTIGEGVTSTTLAPLSLLTEYDIGVTARNNLPGCTLEETMNVPGNDILSCFPTPPAPIVEIDDISNTNMRPAISDIGSYDDDPDIDSRVFMVIREVGSTRLLMTDGDYPIAPSAPAFHWPFGSLDLGNGNFYVNTQNGRITGLTSGVDYELDIYHIGFNDDGAPGLSGGEACILYSSPTRITFTTCESGPVVHASNPSVTNITENSARLSWTNGDGVSRLVLIGENVTGSFFNGISSMHGEDFQSNTNFPDAPLVELGSGTYPSVVYKGSGNFVNVTGLETGTTYGFFVLEYDGDGFCRRYLSNSSFTFSTLSNDLSVSTQNVTNRTSNSAVGGGNIELINNVDVTEKGLVWSFGGNPDVDDNKAIAGSGSGSFTASMTGLLPERSYFVRAYAIANGQVFYGSSRQFFTTSNEPAGTPSNLELVSLQPTSGNNLVATFDWDAASGASGYLLLYRNDGTMPTTTGIEDGVHPEDLDVTSGTFIAGDDFIDGSGFTQTYGVTTGLEYNYLLIPLSMNQDNLPATANYKTDGGITLSFSTDLDAPAISGFQPANGAVDVPSGSLLSIQFDEPVVKGTGDIDLVNSTTLSTIETISVNSANVTVNGQIVIIDPSDLPLSTDIHPVIPSGAFEDANGNSSPAFSGKGGVWQFTTANQGDVTAPTLLRLTPENNDINVNVSSVLRLDFDEAISASTGNLTIKRQSDDSDVQVIPLDGPGVEAFEDYVLISPDALAGTTDLYINIDNGAITDLSRNPYAGISDNSTWTFTTGAAPDTNPPTISSLDPSDNALDIALNSGLRITFNESIRKGSGFIFLKFSVDGTTRESINIDNQNVSVSGSSLTFFPANELPASTELFIEISEGAIEDLSGNSFLGISDPTLWSFTTTAPPDGTQPQLLLNSLSPAIGAIDVPVSSNLSFSFNENVFKGTGNIIIRNVFTDEEVQVIDVTSGLVVISGSTVTINPSSDLTEGQFAIEIPNTAFKDDADNFYTGLQGNSWTFFTPSSPPTLISFTPMDESGDVALDATITLTFSEDVEPGSGLLQIRNRSTNGLIASFQPESSIVSYDQDEVSIDLNLAGTFYGIEVFVSVSNGFIQDLNGNPFTSGFNDINTWNFTFEDQADLNAPTLVNASFSPADNATGIDQDTDLIFSFDEPVSISGGIINIRDFNTDAIIESISLLSNANVVGNEVTVTRSEDLGEGQFYVEIDEETFADAFNNEFTGLFDKNTWNFTTSGTPPAVESLQPAIGAANVGQVLTATAVFDESIAAGIGNILVRNFNSNATLQTIPINDPAVTISGNTLNVDVDLSSYFDMAVYIQVITGAVTDQFGNALAALNNNTWTYSLVAAPDVNAPVLLEGPTSALSPQRGSGTTDPNALLEITFNEEVQAGPGVITLHRFSDDALLQGISASDPAVTINGSMVTIDPPLLFDDVQTYVLVSPDAFQDNSGNSYAGISDKNDWYFFPEISRPELVSITPSAGSTNVPVGEAVTFGLSFSEDIQIDDTGLIRALRKDNNAIAATTFLNDASVQVQGNLLLFDMTFTEHEAFSELEMYLSVNGTYVTDLNGNNANSFGSFATTGFTTEAVDTTHPFIVQGSYLPANQSNNVPYNTDISFEMSEEVVKGAGNILIKNLEDDALIRSIDVTSPEVSISGTTVTINPASDLPERILYVEIEVGTFEDGFGNAFNQTNINWPQAWRLYMFEEPLEIVSLSPAHGSTNIQVNDPLTFEATFSHPIEINPDNPGDILIKYNQGNGTRYTIPANDPAVSVDGNKLSFDLTLDRGMGDFELYVQLLYGVVQDVDGISKNLNLPKGNWHFSTENETPPEVVSFTPNNDATNVDPSSDFIFTFNEDVEKLNFHATIRDYISSSVIEVFDNSHLGVTVSGNQVTLNPTNDLEEGKSFYVTLGYNAVWDHEGAGNIGINDKEVWNFSVGDTEDPILVALTPNDDATEVALDAIFTMEFDEPVQTDGAGSIILRRSSGALVENVAITDPRITGLGTNTLTIDFNSTLITAGDYYITIGNGVVRDAIGNTYQGFTDSDTWSFSASTADIINPTLVSLSPEDEEGNAATNTNLIITLNEDIQWGTGEVLLKDFSSDNLIEAFNSSSGNASISGGALALDPTSDLSETTQYYIEVEADALEDISGNAYAGFLDKTTWNFTTLNSDVTGPSIVSVFPADDDTTVPENITELVITYDEPVQLIGGFFHLRVNSSTVKTFNIATDEVSVLGNVVTLNDVPTLTPHVNYYVTVTGGGTAITDLAGNNSTGWTDNMTWNFGTFSDIIAPTVTSFDPPPGTTSVAEDASFVMTMSEDVLTPASYAITIKEKQGNSTVESFLFNDDPEKVTVNGNQIIINPENDLAPFTEYYITVSGFMDNAFNNFAGFSDNATWNFVVGELDNDPPTIASLTPANGSTDVPLEMGTLSMTFSEPIFPREGDLYIRLRSVAGNGIRQEFGLNSEDVVIDGNSLTLLNVNTFFAGHDYWLQGGTILEDEAGNLLSGWANNATTWSFTTEEIPDDIMLSPADNAIDISPSTDLVMTFNKPVVKGSGFIKIYDYIEQTEILSINVASSNVEVANDEVTITIPGGLPDFNQHVYALIDEGAFLDQNGNEYLGISSRFTWDFTLLSTDQEAPVIVSTSPADNATDVDIRSNLVIEFNEDVFVNNNTPFRVKRYNVNNTQQQILYPSDNITVNGNTITIEPIIDLPFTNQLWIEIPANSIKDEVGNSFGGILVGNRDDWDFTMLDALNFQTFSPADGATFVLPDTDLEITFPRNVVKGSGSIQVREGSSINVLRTLDVSSPEVQIVGNTVTISPLDGLPDQDIPVHVQIDAGAFVDEFGNPSPAINTTTQWNFTISTTPQDLTPPSITSLTPADGSVDISTDNWTFQINFDEPIDAGIGTKRARIRNYDTDAIVTEASHSGYIGIGGDFAIINFNALNELDGTPLDPETHYYVEIEDDLFRDHSANPYTGHTKDDWDFTTMALDLTAPSVVSFNPADEATDVAADANLVITFDENVQSNGSVEFVRLFNKTTGANIAQLATTNASFVIFSGNTITLNSPVDLPVGEEIYVTLPSDGITDLSGNAFAGWSDDETWNFTTAVPDLTAPSIQSLSPGDDQMDAAVDANLVITFDEPVQLGSGSIGIHFYSNDSQTQSVSVSDPEVQVSGNTLTIDPPLNLMTDTQFWIRISSGTVTDLAGNSFAGISVANKDDWNFTTSTTAPNPPMVTLRSPADGAVDVVLDEELSLTFDENIMLAVSGTTKQLVIQRVSAPGGNFEVISITSGLVSGNKLTVPHAEFEAETTYRIFLLDGIIADLDNNFFDGFSNPSDWTFTTIAQDTEAPQVVNLTPADNATDISRTNWSFTIEFNEYIQAGTGTARLKVYDTDGITANAMIGTHLNISDNSATIDFNATGSLDNTTLNADTRFYLEIPDGFFEDLSGNPYTGHTKDDWDFTTEAIVKSDQTITFDVIDDKTFGDDPFILSPTASSNLDVNLSVISGPVTLNGNEITITGVGVVEIAADQPGNGSFNPADQVVRSFTISKASQTISFDEISDRTFGDDSFDIMAIATSGLDVEYSVVSGPISISGTTISINGSGVATIAANQAGNDNYNAAVEVTETFTVAKADQVITVEPIDDKLTTDNAFDISATVDSGLELTFEIDGPATIDGTTITLDGATGTVTITVSQAGNENYNSATEMVTFEVTEEAALSIEGKLDMIKIYPNPVMDFLVVESDSKVEIKLFNLQGRLIKQGLSSTGRLDMRDLIPGVYLLEINNESNKLQKRIVKGN